MICPACQRSLVELSVGGIVLDVCHGGCGGIWFDAGELEKLGETEGGQADFSLNLPVDASIEVDDSVERNCPRCAAEAVMRQIFVGAEGDGIRIDTCGGCGGTWLDQGELEWIQRR